ncbi:MAG: hypothetical protein ACW97O_13390 [Candidatus Thorarchaeota archaeon]
MVRAATGRYKLTLDNLFGTTSNYLAGDWYASLSDFKREVHFRAWCNFFHIILGIVGYLFGILAFLTGISGIRVKWPGLTALVCWTAVFVMGYIQFLM